MEEKDIKANEDDDIIIRNFKKNLTEYSKNFLNIRKIKPKISDAFIESLKLMC